MNVVAKTCELIEKTLGKSPAFRKVEERLYVVKQGSTYVTVSVIAAPKSGSTLVRVYAQVVSGVRPDPALFRTLLTLNAKMRFGAFAFVPDGNLVLIVHSMLGGEHIDAQELTATVSDIALLADGYDDRIVARYGGQRMQDVIEESAMKHIFGNEDKDGDVVWEDHK
jgi:hypothetical protein